MPLLAIANNRSMLEKFKGGSSKKRLLFLLDTNIKWAIETPKSCQLFLLLYYFSSNDSYFKGVTKKITANAEKLLVSYSKDLKPKNGFSHKSACMLMQNYIHGVMFNITARGESVIEKNYKENIKLLVNQLFE